jgi:hypothetical protein
MEIKELDRRKVLGEAALEQRSYVELVAPSSVQNPKFSSTVSCQFVKGSKFCHHQGTTDEYNGTLNSLKISIYAIFSLFRLDQKILVKYLKWWRC